MESDGGECSVCVAVHVRPLIQQEEDEGCKSILDITPEEPQVAPRLLCSSGHLVCVECQMGALTWPSCPSTLQVSLTQHSFRYDYVFGGDHGHPASQLYSQCVAPLVEGLFKGYNATVSPFSAALPLLLVW
jgi:hypothetical protein